jgi:hypothetical protein
MDITQADMWQPSTARPRPPGNAVSGDALGRAVVTGQQSPDHDGSDATARDQLAMVSELWSLCSIKGKIAAQASGQIGNQPVMTLDLPSPQGRRSKITLDNLEASRSDCLAGFRHSRCDATPPFQRRPPRRMPR